MYGLRSPAIFAVCWPAQRGCEHGFSNGGAVAAAIFTTHHTQHTHTHTRCTRRTQLRLAEAAGILNIKDELRETK